MNDSTNLENTIKVVKPEDYKLFLNFIADSIKEEVILTGKDLQEYEYFLDYTSKYLRNKIKVSYSQEFFKDIYGPQKIKDILDIQIVGQEEVKKIVSIVVFNHLKNLEKENFGAKRQHMFLVGPSGSGKTQIFRILRNVLKINVKILDMTNISFTGYGKAGGTHLRDMLKVVEDGDIVVFDEFDKILKKGKERGDAQLLQSEFLKILEGEIKGYENCLFVLTGAFSELLNQKEDINNRKSIGFVKEEIIKNNREEKKLTHRDLINVGILNEILGRITYVLELNKLKMEDYLNILKNDYSDYKIYIKDLESIYNTKIEISNEFLESLIDNDDFSIMGVRGLNNKIIASLNEAIFDFNKDNTPSQIIIKKDGSYEFKYYRKRKLKNKNVINIDKE